MLFFFYGVERLNVDEAWYMLADLRWMQGGVLYRDIVDYNLPSAYIIYLPAALLMKFCGLAPPAALAVETGAFFLLSYFLTLPLLLRMRLPPAVFCFVHLAYLMGGLVQLGSSFGQREHVFLLLMLPYLFANALRYGGEKVALAPAIILGAVAGLACSIKPHFVLVPVIAEATGYICARWVARRYPPLKIDASLTALLVVLALAWISFFVFFPLYFKEVVPLSVALYHSNDLPGLVMHHMQLLAVLFTLLLFTRPPQPNPVLASMHYTFLGAALVGALIYGMQNKGWTYHIMPCLAFLWMVLAVQLSSPGWLKRFYAQKNSMRLLAGVAALAMIGYFEYNFSLYRMVYKDDAVASIVRAHPGPFMVLVSEITPGLPLALEVEKEHPWAMRWPCFCAVPGLVQAQMAQNKPSPYEAPVRQALVEDMRHYKPGLVFASLPECEQRFLPKGFVMLDWLTKDKAFREEWLHYRKTGHVQCFDVYSRTRPQKKNPAR